MTTLAEKLRKELGVDLTKLKPNTRLMLETDGAIYEMVVLRPELSIVQISSTDPALKQPQVGQFVCAQDSDPPDVTIPGWVGKDLLMCLRFKNGYFLSAQIRSIEIITPNWHYTVF
jgi:hypothetical protein